MTELDLTKSILGRHVPRNAGTIKWADGHTTILPAVQIKPQRNLFADVDIPLITFMAGLPPSTKDSAHVTHLADDYMNSDKLLYVVGKSLSNNKPVVIRGAGNRKVWDKITAEDLDSRYGISPNRSASIIGKVIRSMWMCFRCIDRIDIGLRAVDPVKPHITGTIASFLDAMVDPGKIQCILDIPLAHVGLPEPLR